LQIQDRPGIIAARFALGEEVTMASEKVTEKIAHKKSYQIPRLTVYGQLKDLTTGGSGTANEGSSAKNPRP
jgi:hypothetical protein